MGEARIVDHSCLAVRGVGCSTCVEQCPVPGAIRLDQGRPRIDPEHCTGCGVCLFVCPAPQKAILLLPLRARESA
jgi:ferredoxin-type protein NapG